MSTSIGPAKGETAVQLLRNNLAQSMVKKPGRVVMDINELSGYASGRASDNTFEGLIDLRRFEFAILYVQTAA